MAELLELIRSRSPDWVQAEAHGDRLVIVASVTRPSGQKSSAVSLCVWSAADRLYVCENEPRRWPKGCPERHINQDGTFCLGLGDTLSPSNLEQADHWWGWLRKFILGQLVAEKRGVWPQSRALHHGDAALFQKRMEEIAAGTRFELDVQKALELDTGWLTGPLPKLNRRKRRFRNFRAPCPRGCRRGDQPALISDCEDKSLMFDLVSNEELRRDAESKFWKSWRGSACCNTMKRCPLRTGGE